MTETPELYEIFMRHPVVTTDSRDCPPGSVFFALRGESFDGNRFAAAALDKGCAYAVVDDPACVVEGDGRYLLTSDALHALQALAREHRRHFRHPVIQVTGTNGKTTTKELLNAVLSERYKVLCTQGNLNNHIGVPKTLLRLDAGHEIAVVETGANHPGEIRELSDIVCPDCGLITNVGVAHIEGFGSFEGVVRTKGELYDHLRAKAGGFIFLHGDDPHLRAIAEGLDAVTYGSPGHGWAVEGEVVECAPFLRLRWRRGDTGVEEPWHEVQTQMVGAYNLDNALAAACVGLHFGVSAAEADHALATYRPTNSRSEMRQTRHNTLIVDAYNANPSSMEAAIRNFALITPKEGQDKMLILGDMKELGDIADTEHARIISTLQSLDLDHVWLVGQNFERQQPPYPTFHDVEEVKRHLREHPLEGKLILIKGSNSTRLHQLPDLL